MHNFESTVSISKATFSFLGIGLLNPTWRYWRIWLFLLCLCYPIVNGAIMALIAMRMGNQELYSTCIYVMFPNTMVLVKLVVLVAEGRDFNLLMDWVRTCFTKRYGIEVVDDIWKEIREKCMQTTITVTR